jgi:hypothetical protein
MYSFVGADMKCRVIKMRQDGIAVARRELANQHEFTGDLRIVDIREHGYNRIIKVAQLAYAWAQDVLVETLFEVHILWMNEDRFALTGFERVDNDEGKLVDYAQTWLCKLDYMAEPPAIEENDRVRSRRYDEYREPSGRLSA